MLARLAAISVHLPERIETNDDLQREFPDWKMDRIGAKTGIFCRRRSGPSETASDLAFNAATNLFDSGACRPEDIDFLITCTQTPDYLLPTTACLLQHRLGLPSSIGAIDVNQGCSGFIYTLSLAKGLIETGQATSVLILNADTYSKMIRPDDRNLRTLFSDAAAATLVTSRADLSPPNRSFLLGPFLFGTDGGGGANLMARGSGFRDRKEGDSPQPCLFMDGPEVFSFTLRTVPGAYAALLQKAGLNSTDIDLVVPHQANTHMLEHLRERLGVEPYRFLIDLAEVGNTVSASIPIALFRKLAADWRPYPRIALLGFGVGYSWGGCLLTSELGRPI